MRSAVASGAVPAIVTATSAVPPPSITHLAPPSGSRGEERRLVTAVFCDLVGFTPLSERLDVEDVRDIQADYFKRMSPVVNRYGGDSREVRG